jgi:hypothetical protein
VWEEVVTATGNVSVLLLIFLLIFLI